MSADWSEGYFTDIGYTFGYYRELSPAFLRFCLLLNGIQPPDISKTNYCELGIGQGLSVNVHAASCPGQFWGIDFNPSQASFAQRLAAHAGTEAIITDQSFEEFLNADLPPMDYVVLHGIWTWISKENQDIIVQFARKFLRPGGALYISYNCFPGWSAAAPLRQLFALRDRYSNKTANAVERVTESVDFAASVIAASPNYSRVVPSIVDRLSAIKSQDKHYVAHEYFNHEWNVMYFSDVAEALSPAKLDFAASANPLDTIDLVNLSPEAQAILKEIHHPIMRQQLRDYFAFTQFRKDIFMRGMGTLPDRVRTEQLLAMRFVLTSSVEEIPKKVSGSYIEGNLQEEIYDPIINLLASQSYWPKTLRQICQNQDTVNSFGQNLQALTILISLGRVSPCQPEDVSKTMRSKSDRFNREVLERSISSRDISYLASPLTGSAVSVARIQQLFLLARIQKNQDPVAFATKALSENGEKIMKEGVVLEGEEEALQELRSNYESFKEKALPILQALEIVR